MPTYQYQCTVCQEGLEVVQKFTDEALTECPGCQGRLKKVFSAVGIVFKGSGFYRNDSRNTSSGGSVAASSPKNGEKKNATSSTSADTSSTSAGSSASSSASKTSAAPAA